MFLEFSEQPYCHTYFREILPGIKSKLIPATVRLRVVPHSSPGIVERAKRERAWKSPHARKGDTRRGERKISRPWRVKSLGFVCGPSFFSLPSACRLFSRGVIFTRARVLLALLSLRKNGGLLVIYATVCVFIFNYRFPRYGLPFFVVQF